MKYKRGKPTKYVAKEPKRNSDDFSHVSVWRFSHKEYNCLALKRNKMTQMCVVLDPAKSVFVQDGVPPYTANKKQNLAFCVLYLYLSKNCK